MIPKNINLYAGLSGCSLGPKQFYFSQDIIISRTYAKLILPFLTLFEKPTKEKPFGGYMRHGGGGFDFIINNQIFLSNKIKLPKNYDLINIGLLFTFLLRFHANSDVILVLYSDSPFIKGKIPGHNMNLWPIEIEPNRMRFSEKDKKNLITKKTLEWIKKHWITCANLMNNEPKFKLAFSIFSRCNFLQSTSIALLSLWGALESIFSPSKTEIGFRISSNIAVFLEDAGKDRFDLQKYIAKLYNARCHAAHGSSKKSEKSFLETYSIMKSVLIKIIENNHVPTTKELNEQMFGYLQT